MLEIHSIKGFDSDSCRKEVWAEAEGIVHLILVSVFD